MLTILCNMQIADINQDMMKVINNRYGKNLLIKLYGETVEEVLNNSKIWECDIIFIKPDSPIENQLVNPAINKKPVICFINGELKQLN